MTQKVSQAIQISKELGAIGQSVADQLEAVAGQAVGFTLFVWSLPVPQYVNTLAMKTDTISRLRKFIHQWEAGRPDIPLHDAAVAQSLMNIAPDTPIAASDVDPRFAEALQKAANDALDIAAHMLTLRMKGGVRMTGAEVIEAIKSLKR